MFLSLFLYACGAGALYLLGQGLYYLYKIYTSPLLQLPGPPSDSLIFGNFKAIVKADNSVLQEKWLAEYGDVISYAGMFGVSNLCLCVLNPC